MILKSANAQAHSKHAPHLLPNDAQVVPDLVTQESSPGNARLVAALDEPGHARIHSLRQRPTHELQQSEQNNTRLQSKGLRTR